MIKPNNCKIFHNTHLINYNLIKIKLTLLTCTDRQHFQFIDALTSHNEVLTVYSFYKQLKIKQIL